MRRKAVAAGLMVLAGSLAAIVPTAPAQAAACGWHRVPIPSVAGQLLVAPLAVDAISQNDAWAAGFAVKDGSRPNTAIVTPLTWHWNGTRWSTGPHAHLVGTNEQLLSVAMVSATDVWAVGLYMKASLNTNSSIQRTLIHHWNGTKWSVVNSPNVGDKSNSLIAVDSISANNVWAVGSYKDSLDTDQTLIEHWNGTKWSVVSHPTVTPPETFTDVARIPGTTRAWAVGETSTSSTKKTLVQRSSGTSWATVTSANQGTFPSGLSAVAPRTASDAWAVGSYNDGTDKTLVERWNGSSWSIVPSPNAGTGANSLSEAAVHSNTSAWALGSRDVGGGTNRVLAERWNGSSWKVVPFPSIGIDDNGVTDMAAIPGRNSAWATGLYSDNDGFHPLVERYC